MHFSIVIHNFGTQRRTTGQPERFGVFDIGISLEFCNHRVDVGSGIEELQQSKIIQIPKIEIEYTVVVETPIWPAHSVGTPRQL